MRSKELIMRMGEDDWRAPAGRLTGNPQVVPMAPPGPKGGASLLSHFIFITLLFPPFPSHLFSNS